MSKHSCHTTSSPSELTVLGGMPLPQPAGVNAGMSVNPTIRNTYMGSIAFLTASDVFDGACRSAFIDACKAVNGFNLTEVDGDQLIFAHSNAHITWQGMLLDSEYVSDLEDLGKSIRAGGEDELAILRFPRKFGWADPKEALAFWQPLLPVNAARIMFTPMDMNYVYVKLMSGHILHLSLQWDGEDVYDDGLIQAIFLHVVDGHEVAK